MQINFDARSWRIRTAAYRREGGRARFVTYSKTAPDLMGTGWVNDDDNDTGQRGGYQYVQVLCPG